jgi:predicted Zn finger-like uncharacterized protein
MSDAKLTHCPHCHATFKVHDQQIKVAQGKVRCGSCLKVFNALEHIIDNEKSYIPIAKEIVNPETSVPEAEVASQPEPTSKKHEPHSNHSSIQDPEDEEFIFQDDPEEDSEDTSSDSKKSFGDDFNTHFLNLDPTKIKSGHRFSDAIDDPDTTSEFQNNDESWALKMLEEDEREHKLPDPPSSHVKPSSKIKASKTDFISNDLEFSEEFANHDKATSSSTKPAPKSHQNSNILSAREDADPVTGELIHKEPNPFDNLYSDPLPSSHLKSNKRNGIATFIWSIVNLSLLILILGQLAWFHYDKLVQYKSARDAFTFACSVLKCKLPELIDTNMIHSRNLVVRSHPTIKNALIIDAIITNDANFSQPFPDMALYFSNLNNQIVAQRLFTPREYLAGDVANWKEFPTHTPIHISLEIYDPGTDAVNYKVMFFRHRQEHVKKTSLETAKKLTN